MIDGFINLDKPTDATSHDGVAMVRRLLGKVKTGHTGTLDPNATGVLPICVGKATRLAEYVTDLPKVYEGEMTFGQTTDSQDFTGQVLTQAPAAQITEADLLAVLPAYTGALLQIPPMVSAVKKDGKRLYELARQGITVEREPRPVKIYQLELLSFTPGECPKAQLRVTCSKGTYVRTLFHDIGQTLGPGAYLSQLRRTQVGPFRLENAYTLEQLGAMVAVEDFSFLLPPTLGVAHLPQVVIPAEFVEKACHGMVLPYDGGTADCAYQAVTREGRLLGIASIVPTGLHLDKVLLSE